jgi:hypothetical protein
VLYWVNLGTVRADYNCLTNILLNLEKAMPLEECGSIDCDRVCSVSLDYTIRLERLSVKQKVNANRRVVLGKPGHRAGRL